MRRWYEPKKNNPGIDKNAPKKKGFARYFETFWREFFPLIKLNLLFLISCIPVVTIPAAITALSRITVTMVRDRNYFMLSDYWDAFKRDFWRSLIAGLTAVILIAVFGIGTWFYYSLAQTIGKVMLAFAGVSVGLLVTVLGASMYFFPMLAMVELPTSKLMLNSVLIFYNCFKKSLPAFLISNLMIAVGIALLPASVIYIAFIMFSLSSLTANFFIVRPIEEIVLGIKETPANTQESLADAQSATLGSAELGEFPEWDEEEGEN